MTVGGPVFGAPEILLTGVKGDPDEVMKTLRTRGFVVHLVREIDFFVCLGRVWHRRARDGLLQLSWLASGGGGHRSCLIEGGSRWFLWRC